MSQTKLNISYIKEVSFNFTFLLTNLKFCSLHHFLFAI